MTQGTLMRAGAPTSPFATLGHSSPNYSFNANGGGTLSPGSAHSLSFVGASEHTLSNSPIVATSDALTVVQRPRNLTEKARLNAGFVFSSLSLCVCVCVCVLADNVDAACACRCLQPFRVPNNAQYTPPTRRSWTVASRRRCVLGIRKSQLVLYILVHEPVQISVPS